MFLNAVGSRLEYQMPIPGRIVSEGVVSCSSMITTGVTTTIVDIYKIQCTEEVTDECGNKKERYDSWNQDRVRSVNVKQLTQKIDWWIRWIEKVVKIIDIPRP